MQQSPAGSIWAVGTEVHLVNRLANEVAPDRTVVSLDQFGCLCSTMFRVSPNHLLWILEGLVEGEVHNRIVVPEAQKHWVKRAVDARSHAEHVYFTAERSPAGSGACLRSAAIPSRFDPRRTRLDGSLNCRRCRMTSPRSNRTSTRRRCRFITASIIRPT